MPGQALLLPAVRAVDRPVVAPRRGSRWSWHRSADPAHPITRRSVVRRIVRVALSLLLLVVLSVIWVGVRGAIAAKTLIDATPAFNDVVANLTTGPTPTVIASADEIQSAVDRAHGLADDPVWRALEYLPVMGDRLASVRSALAAADILSADGLGPVVALSQTVTFGPYPHPGDGFTSLVQASELEHDVSGIADAILRARSELDAVSTDLGLPVASKPFAAAVATLDKVGDVAAVLVPSVRGMLDISGYSAPATMVVAVLDPDSSRPLGGRVERIFVVTVDHGGVGEITPLDPGAVLAAASASNDFVAAAGGPQAPLLANRPADVTQLASTPDAAAALRAGVAAVIGIDAQSVVFLSPGGLDALTRGLAVPDAGGAAPAGTSLVDALRTATPDQRTGLIDPAVQSAVGTVLGLTPRADILALALRDAVVDGGLRIWFADARTQDALAGTRGTGALPATTVQGIPVTVTLDTGGAPGLLKATGLTVAAGTCGSLWAAHPVLSLDVTLLPTQPAPDPSLAVLPRVLIGVPDETTVESVSDAAGRPLRHTEIALVGQRLLVIETAATTLGVRARVAGRTDQTGGLTAVSRGGVPRSLDGTFRCS